MPKPFQPEIRKMRPFDYFSPESLPEALDLLANRNGATAVIAGGTDLLLQMKSGARQVDTVVNIKRLPELRGITFHPEAGLAIGALTTLRDLTRNPDIGEHYPVLAQTAFLMASEQVRSFATMGGNLCNASPSADLAPPLIALDAQANIMGQSGSRTIPLESLFAGPGEAALSPGELLIDLSIPPPHGGTIYLKQSPRAFMDIAVVGAALGLKMRKGLCEQARIVLGAVAPVPLRVREAEAVLNGHFLNDSLVEQAASLAAQASTPIDDLRGSAWYRKRMVEVLVRRGLNRLRP